MLIFRGVFGICTFDVVIHQITLSTNLVLPKRHKFKDHTRTNETEKTPAFFLSQNLTKEQRLLLVASPFHHTQNPKVLSNWQFCLVKFNEVLVNFTQLDPESRLIRYIQYLGWRRYHLPTSFPTTSKYTHPFQPIMCKIVCFSVVSNSEHINNKTSPFFTASKKYLHALHVASNVCPCFIPWLTFLKLDVFLLTVTHWRRQWKIITSRKS